MSLKTIKHDPPSALENARSVKAGYRFNQLIVVAKAEYRDRSTLWLCRCDCGAERIVPSRDLKNHSVTSCGKRLCRYKALQAIYKAQGHL